MKKVLFILIAVLVLAVSCSQDGIQVYTTVIENNSPYPIYWGIRNAASSEAHVLKKMIPFTRQYILIKESGDYYMDYAQYDSNGVILNEGSFSIENPLNVKTIVFSGGNNTIVWKITYNQKEAHMGMDYSLVQRIRKTQTSDWNKKQIGGTYARRNQKHKSA